MPIYKIVQAESLTVLQHLVNEHIEHGWHVVGGASSHNGVAGQSMISYAPEARRLHDDEPEDVEAEREKPLFAPGRYVRIIKNVDSKGGGVPRRGFVGVVRDVKLIGNSWLYLISVKRPFMDTHNHEWNSPPSFTSSVEVWFREDELESLT